MPAVCFHALDQHVSLVSLLMDQVNKMTDIFSGAFWGKTAIHLQKDVADNIKISNEKNI